jgi:DNA-binding XRE family transcriptional regulator
MASGGRRCRCRPQVYQRGGCTTLWYAIEVTGPNPTHKGQRLRTKGSAWGPRRVELGISINDLSRRSGIQKADLARIESGRMVPTWEEYTKVAAILGLGTADQT